LLVHNTCADDLAKNAPKGLAGNPMFRHALQPFKGGAASNAGRALTKHPNIVGVNASPDRVMKALIDKFGSQAGVNKAAADALKNIMRNGTRSAKNTKAFGNVVDFKLPSGLGARFDATTNEFLHFLGRGL
jgi:hypothetical protein